MTYKCVCGWLALMALSLTAAASSFRYTTSLDKTYQDQRWGLTDAQTGQVLIPPRYDYLGWSDDPYHQHCASVPCRPDDETDGLRLFLPPSEQLLAYRLGDKWGLINMQGKELTRPRYDEVRYLRHGRAVVAQRAGQRLQLGIADQQGQHLLPLRYASLSPGFDHRWVIAAQWADEVSDQLLFGAYTTQGKELLPARYRAFRQSVDGVWAARNLDDRWELWRTDGARWAKTTCTDVGDFSQRYAVVALDHRWGVLGPEDRWLHPARYRTVVPTGPGRFQAEQYPKWQRTDRQGLALGTYEYDEVRAVGPERLAYGVRGQYGLMNLAGNPLTEARFDSIGPFRHGLAVVQRLGQYGLIDQAGQYVLLPRFEALEVLSAGAIRYAEQGRYGLKSPADERLLMAEFDVIDTLSEGMMRVRRNNLWGYADATGRLLIEPEYDLAENFRYGRARVRYRGKEGILNPQGGWEMLPQYDTLLAVGSAGRADVPTGWIARTGTAYELFGPDHQLHYRADSLLRPRSDGRIEVWQRGQCGLLDSVGQGVLPLLFDSLGLVGPEGYLTVRRNGEFGLWHVSNRPVLAANGRYQQIGTWQDGLVGVRLDGQWGFVDEKARLLIANRYEAVQAFHEGMAAVRINGRWGFIDQREQLRVQPYYDAVEPFRLGVARVQRAGKWGLVGTEGQELLAPTCDSLRRLPDGSYLVQIGTQYGLVSPVGRQLLPPRYDQLVPLPNGDLLARRGAKHGVYDAAGRVVVPLIHQAVRYDPYHDGYLTAEGLGKHDL